jgi:hypothetical protein
MDGLDWGAGCEHAQANTMGGTPLSSYRPCLARSCSALARQAAASSGNPVLGPTSAAGLPVPPARGARGDGSCQGCACQAEPDRRPGVGWPVLTLVPPVRSGVVKVLSAVLAGRCPKGSAPPGAGAGPRRAGRGQGRPQGPPAGTRGPQRSEDRSALDAGRSGVAPARPARIGGQVAGRRGPREPAPQARPPIPTRATVAGDRPDAARVVIASRVLARRGAGGA